MYGLDENDLKLIQNKINNQNTYLESNFFTTSTGQIKTLKDISFSANHYKINNFFDIAFTVGFGVYVKP